MPKRPNQANENSKRELDDPGDVSISRAPAPPKKSKSKAMDNVLTDAEKKSLRSAAKKADTGAEIVESTPPPKPATVPTNEKRKKPAVKAKPPPSPIELESTTEAAPAPALALKTRKKPTQLLVPPAPAPAPAPEPEPKTAPAPTTNLEAGQANNTENVVLPKANTGKSKREKKPSPLAQKVADQKAAEQKVKDDKADKKAIKAAKAVTAETPEETEEYLRQMGAIQGPPNPPAKAPTVSVPKPPPPKPPAVSRRSAMDQLIQSHSKPSPPASTISMVSASSSPASVTPSESISQVGPSPPDPSCLSLGKPQPAPTRSSHPTLQIPPPVRRPSREASPAVSSVATDPDEDVLDSINVPENLGSFDFNELLRDLPPPFACEIPGPSELPGPLHEVKLDESALADYTNLKGLARTKMKHKQETPPLEMVRECDKPVVTMALNEFEVSIYSICAFPTDSQAYALAVHANRIACAKIGRNYAIPQNSVYTRILLSRIPQARNRLLKCDANHGLLGAFGLELGTSEQAVNYVKEEVANLTLGPFIYPIEDGQVQVNKPYQHPYFDTMLKVSLYASSKSKGCKNAQSFEVVSIPLMALFATALTRMLHMYSTGRFQKGTNTDAFSAETYAPIYRGHIMTLKSQVENDVGGLRKHLKAMITRARSPHEGAIARLETTASAQRITPIPAVISASAVANFARRTACGRSTSSASNSGVSQVPPPSLSTIATLGATPDPLQATMVAIMSNGSLSEQEKAELLRRLCLGSSQPSRAPESRVESNTQFYDGALAQVRDESSDSEVEAKRAGVFLSADKRAAIVHADMSDSGSKARVEGEGEGEGEPSGAEAYETEPGDGTEEGEMVEEVEEMSGGSTLERTEEASDDSQDEGEADGNKAADSEEIDSEVDNAPASKPRRFFPIPGSLSDPDPGSDNDGSSDGNGSGGAVQVDDGDTIMRSVNEDDDG